MRSIPKSGYDSVPSWGQTHSEIGMLNQYSFAQTWLLTFPFVITATPLAIILSFAIASRFTRYVHTTNIARQRKRLERIWQISSNPTRY